MTKKASSDSATNSKKVVTRERKNIGVKLKTAVLTEAGYRCATPTCRQILALDIHHLWQFADGGGESLANLIALCPTCHALHHRGTIPADALYSFKSMLVSLGQALDLEGIDRLLFLRPLSKDFLIVSGDGLLHFARLIAAGLAEVVQKANNNNQVVTYAVNVSEKGRHLVDAWVSGNREILAVTLGSQAANRKANV